MAFFCLVHGSTQGPSGWDLLAAELRRAGQEVIAPALPDDQPRAGLSLYAEAVGAAISQADVRSNDVRIVAHSASGMFLPLMPALVVGPLTLVYLAAFIPMPGRSLLDDLRSDISMFSPDWIGKNPMDAAVAGHFLFHDCPSERAEWALSTRRLMHAATAMAEPSPAFQRPDVRSFSVICQGDRTLDPVWSRRMTRDRLGVEPLELPGGHCPHVSRPQALADLLLQTSPQTEERGVSPPR